MQDAWPGRSSLVACEAILLPELVEAALRPVAVSVEALRLLHALGVVAQVRNGAALAHLALPLEPLEDLVHLPVEAAVQELRAHCELPRPLEVPLAALLVVSELHGEEGIVPRPLDLAHLGNQVDPVVQSAAILGLVARCPPGLLAEV